MKKWMPYLIVLALLLGGLIVSAFHSPIWYDDAGHFLVAREAARGNGLCYPLDQTGENCNSDSPFITMGPVLAYPLAGWMALLGEKMLVARFGMVLLTLLAVWALVWVGRMLTRPQKAIVAVGLLALNIQFLTYGAETLGELPMMGIVLAGVGCFLAWDRNGRWMWAGLGILTWCLAIGIKEYAILPLGLSLVFWWLMREIARDRPVAILKLGIFFFLALTLTLTLLHGGLNGLIEHYMGRQSYTSEFFAVDLGTSLKFLLLKPLFWLGTAAMVLKWRVKKRAEEGFTLSVQAAWLVFYLLSAGYDRFGFLLFFLPAIYVAEFIPYLWKSLGRITHWAWLRRTMLVFAGLIVFGQQTWWVFGKRIVQPETVNAIEWKATWRLEHAKAKVILTAEQQMAIFLEEFHLKWRLPSIVPSQGRDCNGFHPDFELAHGELFLAGPYAFTEYEKCVDWGNLTVVDSVTAGEEKWVIYRGKD
jgi:hypothetical protein